MPEWANGDVFGTSDARIGSEIRRKRRRNTHIGYSNNVLYKVELEAQEWVDDVTSEEEKPPDDEERRKNPSCCEYEFV